MATTRQPNQLRAFDVVVRQPEAAAAFRDLLGRARPAGQMYALCGLYLVDRPSFDRLVTPFRTAGGKVDVWSGCVTRAEPVSEVVASTAPDAVRLRPGETADQWFDAHPGGGMPDVVGGYYPSELARQVGRWAEREHGANR